MDGPRERAKRVSWVAMRGGFVRICPAGRAADESLRASEAVARQEPLPLARNQYRSHFKFTRIESADDFLSCGE